MALPFVSIIIPCFNAERYVGEAIESALGQTYPHREVIVIDDGSTDSSLEVVKSFREKVRWETGPNRGASAARNRGLELAQGQLVQFLDADDVLYPQKLECQVPFAVDDKSRIVYCSYDTEFLDQRSQSSEQAPVYEGSDPVVFVLKQSGLQTSAPLYWKHHLELAGGFCETLPCAQERDLHLRLACAGLSFRHLAEVLYRVRRLAESVSSDSLRVLDEHSDIAWNAYRLLKESDELTEERSGALAGFLTADARGYLRHGEWAKARNYLAQAKQLHPDGGIPQACGRMPRLIHRILGTRITQRLMEWKWRLLPSM